MHYSCMQNTLHIHLIWLRTKRNTVSVLYRYPQCIPIIICRFTFLWKMKKMKKSNVNMTGYNQKYWQKVQDNFVTKSPHCMNHLANKTNVQLITIKYLNWLTTVWLTQSTSKHRNAFIVFTVRNIVSMTCIVCRDRYSMPQRISQKFQILLGNGKG